MYTHTHNDIIFFLFIQKYRKCIRYKYIYIFFLSLFDSGIKINFSYRLRNNNILYIIIMFSDISIYAFIYIYIIFIFIYYNIISYIYTHQTKDANFVSSFKSKWAFFLFVWFLVYDPDISYFFKYCANWCIFCWVRESYNKFSVWIRIAYCFLLWSRKIHVISIICEERSNYGAWHS